MINKELKCPECQSKEVIKRGILKTENKGKRQRYGCKKCNHRFIQDEPFFRMRNNEKAITLCFDLYYKGLSFRKIGGVFSSVGTSIGNFFKFIWDKMIFWK